MVKSRQKGDEGWNGRVARNLTTHSTRPAPAWLSWSLYGFLGVVNIRGAVGLIRALCVYISLKVFIKWIS